MLKETLQGILIKKYVEETLKGYIHHLKVNWAKATTDPSCMKREYHRGCRIARQREVCQSSPHLKQLIDIPRNHCMQFRCLIASMSLWRGLQTSLVLPSLSPSRNTTYHLISSLKTSWVQRMILLGSSRSLPSMGNHFKWASSTSPIQSHTCHLQSVTYTVSKLLFTYLEIGC